MPTAVNQRRKYHRHEGAEVHHLSESDLDDQQQRNRPQCEQQTGPLLLPRKVEEGGNERQGVVIENLGTNQHRSGGENGDFRFLSRRRTPDAPRDCGGGTSDNAVNGERCLRSNA